MANHEIPRKARCIERLYGLNADGEVVVCKVFQHTRQGHTHPMFIVLQYAQRDRAINRSTRWTREFSGPDAKARLDEAMDEPRRLLTDSRVRAACQVGGAR